MICFPSSFSFQFLSLSNHFRTLHYLFQWQTGRQAGLNLSTRCIQIMKGINSRECVSYPPTQNATEPEIPRHYRYSTPFLLFYIKSHSNCISLHHAPVTPLHFLALSYNPIPLPRWRSHRRLIHRITSPLRLITPTRLLQLNPALLSAITPIVMPSIISIIRVKRRPCKLSLDRWTIRRRWCSTIVRSSCVVRLLMTGWRFVSAHPARSVHRCHSTLAAATTVVAGEEEREKDDDYDNDG